MSSRKTKKPTYTQLEQENLDLRDALEQIADILEEVGVLESTEDDDDVLPGEVKILNPEPTGIVEPKE